MSFQAYKPESVTKSQNVIISIGLTGKFGISMLCYQNFIHPSKQVEIYYDAKNRLIGVKPLQNPSDNAIKIVKSVRSRSIGFSSTKFLKECDIKIELLVRFEPVWHTELKMLIIDLSKPIESKNDTISGKQQLEIENPDFTLFKYAPLGTIHSDLITLSSNGRIGISRVCYDNYFDSALFAELYFDSENHRIGIKPVVKATAMSFSLTNAKTRKQSISLTGYGFMKKNNITPDRSRRYTPEWDDSLKMLVVTLPCNN